MPFRNIPAAPDVRLPKIPLSDITFEHLAAHHDVASFSCTHQELTDYLTADALKNQDAHVAVTYLAIYEGKCVGYFSLLNDSTSLKRLR